MKKKEFIKHYINIFNFPDIGKYPAKQYDLHDEIQRLADIDKIPYPLYLDKICDAFSMQYVETDFDDNDFKKIETASINLSFLRYLEGLEKSIKDEKQD